MEALTQQPQGEQWSLPVFPSTPGFMLDIPNKSVNPSLRRSSEEEEEDRQEEDLQMMLNPELLILGSSRGDSAAAR